MASGVSRFYRTGIPSAWRHEERGGHWELHASVSGKSSGNLSFDQASSSRDLFFDIPKLSQSRKGAERSRSRAARSLPVAIRVPQCWSPEPDLILRLPGL